MMIIKIFGNIIIKILIAHNATFDYHFLNSELKYWELPEIPKERFRCTNEIAKKYLNQKE